MEFKVEVQDVFLGNFLLDDEILNELLKDVGFSCTSLSD